MRILHVIHQYLPEKVGGSELNTRLLATHQAAAGAAPAVFSPATAVAQAPHSRPALEAGVRVYRVPTGPRGAGQVFRSNFRQPQLSRAFTAILAQEKPDLVHIQHLMGLPLDLIKSIQAADIPYVVTLHDYWYLCANAQLLTNYDETICEGPQWWLNCARCAVARAGYPRAYPVLPLLVPVFGLRHGRLQSILEGAAALISPTHFAAGVYTKMGIPPEKIHVIPYGIALPDPPVPPQPHANFHIGYIGGISRQKGLHILIEAMNGLPPAGTRLTIFGDLTAFPTYSAQLQAQAEHPGVHFAGSLPPAQLWQALATLDLVVVPTLWYETASIVVQEAFAAGVPVVASDIGVLPERIQDGADGKLFPAGDAAALREILFNLQAEPTAVAAYRAQIKPVMTIARQAEEVMNLYTAILAKERLIES